MDETKDFTFYLFTRPVKYEGDILYHIYKYICFLYIYVCVCIIYIE